MGWRKKSASSKQASWGGKERSQTARTYRWQGWGAGRSGELARRTGGRWHWRVYFFASLLLLTALVISLLTFKEKTLVIVMGVTDYDYPVPPNAFAREDIAGLQELSGSIVINDISSDWQSRAAGLESWNTALTEANKRLNRNPLVIYVSMHGVVDDRGRPCLLPPGTSPLDTGRFIPLQRFLDALKERVPADATSC